VHRPGLQPVSSPQSETNDNDPASQVFPPKLLPQDQIENQVAGQPATFDPNFLTRIDNFLSTVGEPTADLSELPFFAEEDFLEACLTNGVSSSQSSLENILSEVSPHCVAQEETSTEVSSVEENVDVPSPSPSHGGAQEVPSTGVSNVEEEQMDFETTWHLGVPSPQPENPCSDILDDYIVPRPSPKPQTFSNTLLTPVSDVFSIQVTTHGGNPPVVQAPPILTGPSGSQRVSVIMPRPGLANKPLTTQPQHGKPMNPSMGNTGGDLPFVIQVTPIPVQISPAPSACSAPRGKKVPKTNPERCRDYRNRQKTKKEKDEQELRQLDAKNRALKAKEAALSDKIRRIKEAARRIGLGNYFNKDKM